MPTLPNFGQCWPTSGIQGQWFLICRSCEMHLIHYDVSYPRVIWHVLWAATKIGLLENVLGFRSVLNTVLAVIQWNIPGSLYWTGHWNLVIGLQHESSFNYYYWGMPLRAWLWTRIQFAHIPKMLTCLFWVVRNIQCICSTIHFQTPTSRRRLYIYLIRKDVMTAEALSGDFTSFLKTKQTNILGGFRDSVVKIDWILNWMASTCSSWFQLDIAPTCPNLCQLVPVRHQQSK